MKSAPTPPPPPDPVETAQAQQAFNTFNQVTPFGSLMFDLPSVQQLPSGDASGPLAGQVPPAGIPSGSGFGVGGGNQFASPGTATLTLPPEIQAILDAQTQVSQNTLDQALALQGQTTAEPLDTSGLPALQSGFDIPDFDAVRDDIFSQTQALLNRDEAQREDRLLQRLANQGLDQGGRAFQNELTAFERARSDALAQAALGATLSAGAEQSRLAGLNRAQAGFGNTARTQGLNELTSLDAFQRNQLAQLLGLQQVQAPTLNSFFAPGATDFIGAQANQIAAQNAIFNAQNQRHAAGLGGLFGLGAAGIGALPDLLELSSRRFKDELGDISILDRMRSVPVKVWRYKWSPEPHVGPYAEDFHEVFGLGDGITIPIIDYLGVVFAGLKEAGERIEALEA